MKTFLHTIKFTKMHGAGNDYIYVYTPECPIDDPAAFSVRWSHRHFGIGSDGVVLIGLGEKADTSIFAKVGCTADFTMRIFNADGSEAMMCGNGVRCVAKYVYDHHLTDKTRVSVATRSGVKMVDLHLEGGKAVAATVDMGKPVLREKKLEAGFFVSMGNPHVVFFVDDVEAIPLTEEGRRLEREALPDGERCNVEFAQVRSDGSIRMRVWERGSGVTLACGTGACATTVAAYAMGLTGRKNRIETDGGWLVVEWHEDGHVMMTGPVETVFEGSVYTDVSTE